MSSRPEVYAVIDSERDYQRQSSKCGDRPHTVGEWVLLLEEYAAKARHAWAHQRGDLQALHDVRKVAALAVACMEQHGAVRRATAEAPPPANPTEPSDEEPALARVQFTIEDNPDGTVNIALEIEPATCKGSPTKAQQFGATVAGALASLKPKPEGQP